MLILASASPRRHTLLQYLGVAFKVVVSQVDEKQVRAATPAQLASQLAEAKAREVANRYPNNYILGMDTMVALEGQTLGKPANSLQNAEFLRQLSGRTQQVYSAVHLIGGSKSSGGVVCSRVTFCQLSEAEISHYVSTGEGLDKAGGYGIQGQGMALVERIEGDYSNVVGLPLRLTMQLLRSSGIAVWGQLE